MSLNECPKHFEEYPAGSFCSQCAEERHDLHVQQQAETSSQYTKKIIKNGDKCVAVYTKKEKKNNDT